MRPADERMRVADTARHGSRERWRVPRGSSALALSCALLGPAGASAQSAEADAGSPPPERIVVSFQQRSRVEKQTHPFRIDELGATRVLAFRTRLQVDVRKMIGPLGAFVELQDARSAWTDGPFVVPARHVNHLDFKQVLLRLGSARVFGSSLSGGLQIGRFTLDLGHRRLSARNRMRNTTNAFDGAYGWLTAGDGSSLQAFVTRPVRLEPYELDRSEGNRLFWGAWATVGRWRLLQTELFALRLDESGETVTGRRLTTFGGRLYKNQSPGELDYELESVWQAGKSVGLDHDAYFLHLEAGYAFRRARARLSVLYDQVSGDEDPLDRRSERFDTLFGARRFEYAPTGIYGPFFRANIQGPGVRLVASPTPAVEILVVHRVLRLAQAKDAWVGSGLQDVTGASGRSLGGHLEARLRWRPRRWLLVGAAYGHFFKGSFLDRVPGSPGTPDSDFFTIGFEVGEVLLAR
jgi:hypothetical protein